MSEEKITVTILKWLQNNGWQIVCFDFPQSGMGVSLHPNQDLREKTKNKGAIIPDIVANKDRMSLFFENKNRFFLSDFQKVNIIKTGGEYNNSITELLKNHPTDELYYGIGLPFSKLLKKKLMEHDHLVDFVISVSLELEIDILKGEELFKK